MIPISQINRKETALHCLFSVIFIKDIQITQNSVNQEAKKML